MISNPLLRLAQSQAPFFTSYGQERLELGGKVVVNWLNKLVNYYFEELGLQLGQAVILDLPLHWRTILWLQAGWLAGLDMWVSNAETASSQLEQEEFWQRHPEIAAIVTATPEKYQAAAEAGCEVVGLELASLALRYRRPLPDFAVDGNATVLAQPDMLLSEVKLPRKAEIACLCGAAVQVVELDSEGEEKTKAKLIKIGEHAFRDFSGKRVMINLNMYKWDTREISALLLELWEVGASAVLIKETNDLKKLVKLEKVNLCLQKPPANMKNM